MDNRTKQFSGHITDVRQDQTLAGRVPFILVMSHFSLAKRDHVTWFVTGEVIMFTSVFDSTSPEAEAVPVGFVLNATVLFSYTL